MAGKVAARFSSHIWDRNSTPYVNFDASIARIFYEARLDPGKKFLAGIMVMSEKIASDD